MSKEAEGPSDGAAENEGKPMDPKRLPASEPRPATNRAVPIGRPMTDEEYRKAKERARQEKPAKDTKGQEDPSARRKSSGEAEHGEGTTEPEVPRE